MSAEKQNISIIEDNVQKIYQHIKKVLSIIKKGNKDKTFGQILLKIEELVENASISGEPDNATILGLENQRVSFISNIITTLQHHVQYQVLHIRSYVIQFIGCMAKEEPILFSALTQCKIFLHRKKKNRYFEIFYFLKNSRK